jgi:hypothetical protein
MARAASVFVAWLLFSAFVSAVGAQQLSDFRRATASEKAQYTCIPCTQQCSVCSGNLEVCRSACLKMGNPKVLKGVGCGVRFGYVIC